MSQPVCPQCRFSNPGEAPRCPACGACLGSPTAPLAHSGRSVRVTGGALWLDDLKLPDPSPAVDVKTIVDELRARKKKARRAHVRRQVMRGAAALRSPGGSSIRVLVLEHDDDKRELLRSLLESFGFQVVGGASLEDVHSSLSEDRSMFVAAFVGIESRSAEGHDGIELCRSLRHAGLVETKATSALVLLAETLRPTDRVQATLAGCGEVIVGAITRGSVAAALDHLDVGWPADRRMR